METQMLQKLRPQLITPEGFAPFGQVIFATEGEQEFDATNAQLQLSLGTPRFYIMRLRYHGLKFNRITRHHQCTQCLGSLGGKSWMIAVGQPGELTEQNWEQIVAFRVPGDCFVKLEVGTWHAGPFFEDPIVEFYNLELSDTNKIDHDTCNLQESYGVEFEFFDPSPVSKD
jgi:ureidoglycolate hydrolase